MEHQARPEAISGGIGGIPVIAELRQARRRGLLLMPQIASILPGKDGGNLLNCLFFKEKLIIVLSSGAWAYYLRLHENAIREVLSRHQAASVQLVYKVLPGAGQSNRHRQHHPQLLPGRQTIDSVMVTAKGLHHQGLRAAMRQLCATLAGLRHKAAASPPGSSATGSSATGSPAR